MRMKISSVMILVLSFVVGCMTTPVNTTPVKAISELCEGQYTPSYSFTPQTKTDQSSGYTIGLLKMVVTAHFAGKEENVANKITGLPTFTNEFAKSLEQILLSKGVGVKGPFESYEDMTYPDRAQCSYLIRPQLDWDVSASLGPPTSLPDYKYNIDKRNWVTFVKRSLTNTVKCTLRYDILEPLSNQKLAVHKLDSQPISNMGDYIMETINSVVTTPDGAWLYNPDGSVKLDQKSSVLDSKRGCYNIDNIDLRALDALFKEYVPKTENLLSVEEFRHLDTYKKDLSEKKVY